MVKLLCGQYSTTVSDRASRTRIFVVNLLVGRFGEEAIFSRLFSLVDDG